MRPPTHVFPDPERLAAALAERIADEIEAATGPFLLGCPGGRSAAQTYAALAAEAGRRALDLSGLIIVMMDEYVGPDRHRVAATEPHSCAGFGRARIVEPLNAAARVPVPAGNFWLPDPERPQEYDERIAAAGDIDLFLLASGTSDGHVAFNPPGTTRDSRTRVVPLDESTRRDNMATFPTFGSLEEVPRHGVTVGVGTIADRSRSVVMIAHGEEKAVTAARLESAERYDPDWPATVIAECRNPVLLLDQAAARHASSVNV